MAWGQAPSAPSAPSVSAALLLLLLATVAGAGQAPGAQQRELGQVPAPLFAASAHPAQRCGPAAVPEGVELTAAEQELLDYVCWPAPEVAATAAADVLPPLAAEPRSGVPAGVNCTVVQW